MSDSSEESHNTATAKKRKRINRVMARPKCDKTWCAHADPTQPHADQGDCSGSDEDTDSNGYMRTHCVACRQLCWDSHRLCCNECGASVCFTCRAKNMCTGKDPKCYLCRLRDSTDVHCFQCVIKNLKLWCRNPQCETVYNVSALLPKVYNRGLAKDIIPDYGASVTADRIGHYEWCVEMLDTQETNDLPTHMLKTFAEKLNVRLPYLSKDVLRDTVSRAMNRERKFKQEHETRSGK